MRSEPACDARMRWVSSDDSAKRAEEVLNLFGKRRWLLHGREMTALFHLGPALDIGVRPLCDGAGRHNDFLRKSGIPGGNRDGLGWRDRPGRVQASVIRPEPS